MSLEQIAGHKFTEGPMRDRCARCERRWAEVIASRIICPGFAMCDQYDQQFDNEREAMMAAIIGTSSGSAPQASEPYEPEGDAAEPDIFAGIIY